ncbi:MAG: hypothetical protein M1831_007036 [Alyxoria varia]|nr:MAG: hypothetical protein M1831_007036 [Alyxoria varia]
MRLSPLLPTTPAESSAPPPATAGTAPTHTGSTSTVNIRRQVIYNGAVIEPPSATTTVNIVLQNCTIFGGLHLPDSRGSLGSVAYQAHNSRVPEHAYPDAAVTASGVDRRRARVLRGDDDEDDEESSGDASSPESSSGEEDDDAMDVDPGPARGNDNDNDEGSGAGEQSSEAGGPPNDVYGESEEDEEEYEPPSFTNVSFPVRGTKRAHEGGGEAPGAGEEGGGKRMRGEEGGEKGEEGEGKEEGGSEENAGAESAGRKPLPGLGQHF